MSLPTMPSISDGLTLENSISQILSSIAMEELGLSHIINAEGEKLQYVLGTLPGKNSSSPTIEELLSINESMKELLSTISTNQLYLTNKMTAAMNLYAKHKDVPGGSTGSGNNGGAGGGGSGGSGGAIDPTDEMPKGVIGRTLDAQRAGDTVNWVEIATYNSYSLILRSDFIQISPDPSKTTTDWNVTSYGDTNYGNSRLAEKTNAWFDVDPSVPLPTSSYLAIDANLRKFTIRNNAYQKIGAPGNPGDPNGFSKPSGQASSTGANVAFALSYAEAANYCSERYGWFPVDSNSTANANFKKLASHTGESFWLRTPGIAKGTMGSVTLTGNDGWAYETSLTNTALIYPALWVDSAIFSSGS